MKNLFLLFALISFVSCKEEKLKKINTNLMCKQPVEYKIQQPGIIALKSGKSKVKFAKTTEQTK